MSSRYEEVYQRSLQDPEGFWAEAAEDVRWDKRWDTVLDRSNPPFYRWFVGGELNTCFNAVDRHVEEGRGGQLALVYDSPVTDTVRRYDFRELQEQVARFAGVLKNLGVGKGDPTLSLQMLNDRKFGYTTKSPLITHTQAVVVVSLLSSLDLVHKQVAWAAQAQGVQPEPVQLPNEHLQLLSSLTRTGSFETLPTISPSSENENQKFQSRQKIIDHRNGYDPGWLCDEGSTQCLFGGRGTFGTAPTTVSEI